VPLSDWLRRPSGEPLPYRLCKLAVAPVERSALHGRIEARFHAMLEQGFMTEVGALFRRGDLDLSKPSMRAVGYRQAWEYLTGSMEYTAMVGRAITATRQLAKRQLTWLRADVEAQWFDSRDKKLLDRVLKILVGNFIN